MRYLLLLLAAALSAETTYQKPPKEILDLLNAPVTPLVSISPTNDRILLIEPVRYPPIKDMSQPMLRLAGVRINPAINGPFMAPRYVSLTIKTIATGKEVKVQLPPDSFSGNLTWSPNGQKIAFSNTHATGIDLWVADVATGAAKRLSPLRLNAAVGSPITWMPDGKTLVVKTVPANRGKAPEESRVPVGPTVQESYGRQAPTMTYQDMLKNPHDEALFEYYGTSQLALVDINTGAASLVGKPAIYVQSTPSPDGQFLLTRRVQRPFSYVLPWSRFPYELEVIDRTGKVVHTVASKPLADQIPLDGVDVGPRSVFWRPTECATLIWFEALDGGDPKKKVPHRDRVMVHRAPFTSAPSEIAKTVHRANDLEFAESGGIALLSDYDRDRRWTTTRVIDVNDAGRESVLLFDRSVNDRYGNPGQPLTKVLPNGQGAIILKDDWILLSGAGSSPDGDRPFLRRLNLKTKQVEEIFRSDAASYEAVVDTLSEDGKTFITRRESPTEAPNYFIRTVGSADRKALTEFKDPQPQIRGIKKQLVKYKRPDGVDLSFTLYLPADHKQGERLPTVVWAYPLEYNDPSTAGQVSGSTNRFTLLTGYSHLFFASLGYAVLDSATMPIVGDPETVNNTYIEQVTASAKAAIDKAVEMGVTDPSRVGVGGHSYGAFMTANLLAHTDLFRAGIARSGAYNRTLTPFGFQSERRTFWEAQDMYMKVSPFAYAHKIKEPILLIHGEADNNTGTYPIQSERMYQAIRGNAGNVRYVTLPYESHGYMGRESIEHTLWEMITWFDKHVKNAPKRTTSDRD